MCNFLSAVVLRNGDVLTHPLLDSHSDLVRYFQLPDTSAHHQHFAKVELTPNDWLNVETWTFQLDEETAPGWWDDIKTQAEATLRERARLMILTTGRKDLILEGCWILAGDAEIADFRGGRIVAMEGGTLQAMWGGTLEAMEGGTLQAMWGGTLQAMWGGTLEAMEGGTLQAMRGGTLQAMRGGTLQAMQGGTLSEPVTSPYATLSAQVQGFLKAKTPKPKKPRAKKPAKKKARR